MKPAFFPDLLQPRAVSELVHRRVEPKDCVQVSRMADLVASRENMASLVFILAVFPNLVLVIFFPTAPST